MALVAFGFCGFCGFWLWWLLASVAFVASGFCGFWLLWLLASVAFGFCGFWLLCGFWVVWLLWLLASVWVLASCIDVGLYLYWNLNGFSSKTNLFKLYISFILNSLFWWVFYCISLLHYLLLLTLLDLDKICTCNAFPLEKEPHRPPKNKKHNSKQTNPN